MWTHRHSLISTLPQLSSHKSIWLWAEVGAEWRALVKSPKLKSNKPRGRTEWLCVAGKESTNQKQKQAPECLLVIQVAAEWHTEWDPIQPVNTMGALWCESASWAGITDSTAHWLATGHRAPSTDSATEGGEGAGWLVKSVGHLPLPEETCGGVNTCILLSKHTQINTFSGYVRCIHTYTILGDWTSGCRTWSAAPSVTQPWLNGTDFVCVCVFCGLITLWCSSFTLAVIDTLV